MRSTSDFDLRTRAAYQQFIQDLPEPLAWDTETTGLAFADTPFCLTVAWRRKDGSLTSHYIELDDYGRAIAWQMLTSVGTWVLHNAKFDLQKMIVAGILTEDDVSKVTIHDTEALAHLDDENRRKGLKFLAKELLGEETDEADVLRVEMRKRKIKKDEGFHLLPHEILVPYAIKDAEFTLKLYERLLPRVQRYDDLWQLYQLEQQLMLVLLDMEIAGMGVDIDYAKRTAREYAKTALRTEIKIRKLVGKDDFNPNSVPQLKAALEARGVETEKTDKLTLESLEDPLAEAVLTLRKTRKMHGTYLVPLTQEALSNGDGEYVLHPNFRQHGTRTGRMSSGGAEG